jgi:hypothetical protein
MGEGESVVGGKESEREIERATELPRACKSQREERERARARKGREKER